MMSMNIYFLIILILWTLNIGGHLINHGKPVHGEFNFWTALIRFSLMLFLTFMAIRTGF